MKSLTSATSIILMTFLITGCLGEPGNGKKGELDNAYLEFDKSYVRGCVETNTEEGLLSPSQVDDYCSCTLEKIHSEFDDVLDASRAMLSMNEVEMLRFFAPCIPLGNGSGNGISAEFREQFILECNLSAMDEDVWSQNEAEEYCYCVLGLLETQFENELEIMSFIGQISEAEMMDYVAPCLFE